MMKKQYIALHAFRYHSMNLLVIIVNVFVVWNLYHIGWFGEVTEDFGDVIRLFLIENLYHSIDLIFYALFAVTTWGLYKKTKHKEIVFDLTGFRMIMLSSIILITVILALLFTIRDQGGSLLIAFIMIFYIPLIFNYMYVEINKKIIPNEYGNAL